MLDKRFLFLYPVLTGEAARKPTAPAQQLRKRIDADRIVCKGRRIPFHCGMEENKRETKAREKLSHTGGCPAIKMIYPPTVQTINHASPMSNH
jgi:hypothetical protein